MTDSLQREIRTLRELYWSDRDPDGRVFATLADAYRRSGEIRQAMELLEEGRDRLPGFPSGHVVAARLYCDAGMMEEATFAARRALELDEQNVEALRSLARALEASGADLEARRVRGRLSELEFPGGGAYGDEGGEAAEFGAVGGDEVMSLADLAPDAPTDPLDTSAADEPLSLDALAPDQPAETVVDLAELAPDEAVPLDALAPEGPEAEPGIAEPAPEEIVSLDALAPDGPEMEDDVGKPAPEEVVSLDALAPDGPDAEADLGGSAPGEAGGEEIPTDQPTLDEAGSPDGLTPEETEASAGEQEPVGSPDDLGPEESGADPDAGAAAEGPEEGADEEGAEAHEEESQAPLPTRTLADLYARQGLTERALSVYRQLLMVTPDDERLRRRIADLSGASEGGSEPDVSDTADDLEAVAAEAPDAGTLTGEDPERSPEPSAGEPESDEDEEASLSESGWTPGDLPEEPEVDTPFAWTDTVDEEAPRAPDPGPPVEQYFRRMLAWGEERDRERGADEGEA